MHGQRMITGPAKRVDSVVPTPSRAQPPVAIYGVSWARVSGSLWRTVAGLDAGAATMVGPLYVSETAPARMRGISAIVRTGAIPRLVDIDGSFCMDPADLERKIGPRSKAVLIVNMSGVMGRNAASRRPLQSRKPRLLQDARRQSAPCSKGCCLLFGQTAPTVFLLNKK